MAITQCLPPLGLGPEILSASRVSCVGSKQRRVVVKTFHESERFLVRGNGWVVPLLLQAAGNKEVRVVGRISGSDLITFGGENQSQKRWAAGCNTSLSNAIISGLLARLYPQHQKGIAASSNSSSSSFPASSGVGAAAAAQGQADNSKQYTEDGRPMQLENQSSSGRRENERDCLQLDSPGNDCRRQDEYNGTARDFIGEDNGRLIGDTRVESWERLSEGDSYNGSSPSSSSSSVISGPPSAGSKEPVYEVIEICQVGEAVKKLVSRRQLLRTSGLRLRDLRRVDPSLWVTNSAPALLVRDEAILLNLGSLRAIATTQEVLIFDHQSVGAKALMETLIPRLNDRNNASGPVIPFELEVIESALISRTQRLERSLMDVEPHVLALLKVLPTCMTADVLEELRVSKQALVEVGAKAGALRQMLLELLEHPQDIRRMVIMGRVCTLKADGGVDCAAPQDKLVAEDEEEEMEMLLEYYLQRCESCHGQALKLLSSAKEMEDSIAVNLSSRRLEVSRLELLLQVGMFCAALGALVAALGALIAGIFGMNLKNYLEERALAFGITTGAIILGGIALFLYMFSYLSNRKIL